jgi:diguanylate cyclase (GGDEF)-like protein
MGVLVMDVGVQGDALLGSSTALLMALGEQIGLALESARLYRDTRDLALHDPLTALPNRRLLDLNGANLVARARRYETPLSAIMLDIDGFKAFNDAHGHVAGDALLAKIAQIISARRRAADFAFRYAGDEFLCLLPETELETAAFVAERMRAAVAAAGEATVSAGVATYNPQMESIANLIRAADAALYLAKHAGRNRVERTVTGTTAEEKVFKPVARCEDGAG